MENSEFSNSQLSFPDAELLPMQGATCLCYRVKLYGKLHFLKRLKPELRTNPRYVAAMRKEFETGYSLDHPHLVHYLACGDDYLLTEWVDGTTLDDFAEQNPQFFKSRDNVQRLVGELLDVVHYLHSHQVVHLDLKPSNILITRVGNELKLTDLGFCYTDTFTDTMGRTDSFAAPEQLSSNGQVDHRTDIYALGRILDTLPCAKRFSKVIDRCTQPSPGERYQSVDQLRKALNNNKTRWLAAAASIATAALIALGAAQWIKNDSATIHATPQVADTILATSPATEPPTSPATSPAPAHTVQPPLEATTHDDNSTANVPLKKEQHNIAATAPAQQLPAQPAPTKPATISEETLFNELSAATRPIYNKYLKQYKDIDVLDTCYMKAKSQCEREMEATLHRLYQTKYKPMGVDESDYGAVAVRTLYQ